MSHIQLSESTIPASPAAGRRIIFASSDGFYGLDSAGGTTLFGAGGGGGGGIAAAAGTQTGASGTVVFSNSNNFTFGMSGSTRITASFSESTHSHASPAFSGSNGSFTANTVTFGNLNGLSFYTSNGSIVGSYTVGGGAGGVAAAAGTQTGTSGTIVFANSNDFTFGMSGSSQITASFSQSTHSHSTAPGAIAAGTQTGTSGTIVFANSNNMTFGMSGSSQITASFSQSVQTQASGAIAGSGFTSTTTAGTAVVGTHNSAGLSMAFPVALTTARASTDAIGLATAQSNVTWTANSAGLSFDARGYAGTASSFGGTNISGSMTHNSGGLTLSMSVAAPGGGGGIAAAAGTQTATSGTIVFANSNNFTFGMSGSSQITASFSESTHSHATPAFSGSNGSFTAATLSLGTLNGLTFYTSNGSIVASHNALTSQSNQAFSAAGGSSAFQTLGFSDTNGVSFSNSGGSVVATVRTDYASSIHAHNATLFAASNTTQSSSGTVNISSIVFAGAGIASVGVTNGSVVISVPSGGGAGDGGNILAAGTRTAGSNSTVLFSNANGVTFGLDAVNGSVMTASVAAGGGGAIPQYYATSPWAADNVALITNITALSQRPIFVPFQVMGDLTANELMWKMSRSTNSSNNFTVHLGVYSYVNSTQISLLGSNSHSYSNTATASITGVRMFEVSLGTNFSTFSAGQYIAAFIFSNTASASANYSLMGGTTLNPHVGGIHPGADTYVTHTSHQPVPMHGRYTTTSGALPASVGASQIIGQLTGASMAIPMGFTIGWDN